MFRDCSNLNSITLGYTGNFADAPTNAFINWVNGVAASGTLTYEGSDTTVGVSAIPSGWTVVAPVVASPLCFTANQAYSTVSLAKEGSPDDVSLETSTDGVNWSDYTIGTSKLMRRIGDKVYFRAKNENSTISKDESNFYYFSG